MNEGSNMTQPAYEMQKLSAPSNLLSFRNCGQLDPEAINDTPKATYGHQEAINGSGKRNEPTNDSSADSAQTAIPRQISNDDLRKRFLDGLSELIGNDKGGNYVSCAVMRENETNRCADIWIARNMGFVKKDFTLLNMLGEVLKSVTEGSSGKRLDGNSVFTHANNK